MEGEGEINLLEHLGLLFRCCRDAHAHTHAHTHTHTHVDTTQICRLISAAEVTDSR